MPLTLDEGTAIAGIGMLVAGIAWVANLRERINSHEDKLKENEKAHETILALNASDHAQIKDDVQYIRERVDRALNGRGSSVAPKGPAET